MTAEASALPEYGWFSDLLADSPLKIKTQLAQLGLKPGGPVRARVVWQRGRRIINVYDLYDVHEAVPKRPRTAAQQAALAKAHLAKCTCTHCHMVAERPLPHRLCAVCLQARARETERERLRELQAVAQQWLADPTAVILDTETTDLDGYLVQVAVIDMTGTVCLETLVNPQTPISAEASHVHGICAAHVRDAPTFAQLVDKIHVVLQGRLVITYHARFDHNILCNEVLRLHGMAPWQQACAARDRWLEAMRWGCAMELYAEWVGDWSSRHRGYRWQPLLGGDHTALGDSLATLRLLKRIADGPDDEEPMR
jgi:DNA polymerase-3 subunit epsilon